MYRRWQRKSVPFFPLRRTTCTSPAFFTIHPADIDGVALTSGGLNISVARVGGGNFHAAPSQVFQNPDGSYTFDPSDPSYAALEEGEILEIIAGSTVTDDQGETDSSTLTITLTGTAIPAPKILNLAANSTPQGIQSFTVTFSSRLGTPYTIERSRDLVDWNALTAIVGEDNSTEFTDENPILDGDPVFYRARQNSP